MNDFITHVPLIHNLTNLIEYLLLFNVLLSGLVILFAFRASEYKQQADDLAAELNETIGTTINRESPEQPVSRSRNRSTR